MDVHVGGGGGGSVRGDNDGEVGLQLLADRREAIVAAATGSLEPHGMAPWSARPY